MRKGCLITGAVPPRKQASIAAAGRLLGLQSERLRCGAHYGNHLWNKSQHISEAEAKPGDLVFFWRERMGYSRKVMWGHLLGNGMMGVRGDPIKYANIHSSYWESTSGIGGFQK